MAPTRSHCQNLLVKANTRYWHQRPLGFGDSCSGSQTSCWLVPELRYTRSELLSVIPAVGAS